MPKEEKTQVIVELTHHTVHALRAVNGTVEAGGECAIDNKAALDALLAAVAPSEKADAAKAAAVWPDGMGWHLSTDTEAILDRTADALRAIAGAAQGRSKFPFSYAACNAGDGGPISADGTEKWILAHCPRETLGRACGAVPGVKADPAGAGPAALARVGAIARSLRAAGAGSVALWDLGTEQSNLLLVTAGGVEGTAPCAVGLNAVFEAVQSALKLKFRGAGARLFFNEGYDFAEPGPRIGAIIGPSLRQALSLLPQAGGPPALACIGLTGKQAWFLREAAAAAGAAPWAPDLGTIAGYLGIRFSDEGVQASFSPASIGVFELLSLRMGAKDAWNPAWTEAEAPAPEVVEEPVAAEEPAPVEEPAPPPARPKPVLVSEGGPAPPVTPRPPKPPVAPKPEAQAPAETPAKPPRPPVPASTAPFSAASLARPPEPVAPVPGASPLPPAFPAPGDSGLRKAPAADAPLPKAIRTAPPIEAEKPKAAVPAEGEAERQEETQPKGRVGFYVGVVAAAAIVFAAIAVALDYRMQKIKENDIEQQQALAHHLAEVRVKEAPQVRKEQPEPVRPEAEVSVTLPPPAGEPARPAAAVTAEPGGYKGTLVVATAPAGASVSIDGAAPLVSPVKAEGVAQGTHRVHISLAGHDPVELNAEVRANKTTDL